MNEITSVIESREKIIWEGKPKSAPYFFRAILGILLFELLVGFFLFTRFQSPAILITGLLVLFVFLITMALLRYNFIHYALTNRRVILQSGIFGRNYKSINYDDIQNSSVNRGLINWVFGVGTISIFSGEIVSAGKGGVQSKYDNLIYLDNADDILRKLQEHTTNMEEEMYGGKNVVQKVKVVKD